MSVDASPPLLEMRGIGKRFGGTEALRDVALTLRAGEVLALIGENGAGKSTLMKILSGAVAPDAGAMRLAGASYAPAGPAAAQRAGVAMIYQELNLAPDLSVEDNIMLGRERSAWGLLRRGAQRPRVAAALAELGHPDLRPETPVGALSIGARQLVEIARALVFDARVVVFDEPTSSLSGQDTRRLFEVIRRLRAQGRGVIYISHFLEEVREVCDRYCVLRDGRPVGEGELAGVAEERIVSLMVGRDVDELFPRVPHTPGEVVLRIESLSGRRAPENATLELRRGEVVGVAGLVGAGRTELLRTLFGLDPVRSGRVVVAGAALRPRPAAAIAAGLGMVSEDRKAEGLAQGLSIEDNLSLSRLAPYSIAGWLNGAKRTRAMVDWMERLSVKAQSPRQAVGELSGGNQQKVAIARVMHQGADVLLLDEPTRGIDVGTKSEIYRHIGELAAAGRCVVFVSSYLPELLAVCDRVAVMSRGRIREVRATADWTEESVMACAIGGESTTGGSAPTPSERREAEVEERQP